MAQQFMWCLARLGIFGRIDEGYINPIYNKHKNYNVAIFDGFELAKLRSKIKLTGRKGLLLKELQLSLRGSNHGNRLGKWVSENLVKFANDNGVNIHYRDQHKRISRYDLKRYLAKINKHSADLEWLTNENIYWDRLKRIEKGDRVEVFDRTVSPQSPNFIANGFVVHNSIEQDADIVMLLHREDYYRPRDAEKDGLAEVDIAKNRRGPTGWAKLMFLEEYVLFGDYREI